MDRVTVVNSGHVKRRFSEYATEIGRQFCPYIIPALEQNILSVHSYRIDVDDLYVAQEELFYLGIIHTEMFRKLRRDGKGGVRHCLCDNVIVDFSADLSSRVAEVMSWPHWLLKILYLQTNVMYGKFWRGQTQKDKLGRDIPSPPFNFLSIRTGIPPIDIERFFAETPYLRGVLAEGADDGEDVHRLVPGAPSQPFDADTLREVRYYRMALSWALATHGDEISSEEAIKIRHGVGMSV